MRIGMLFIPLLLFSGCAAQPTGPNVAAMPAAGKPFGVFQQELAQCKQFATGETSGGADHANLRQLGTAAIGTMLGGGLGAALGHGPGAAIGAATGALGGTLLGAGPASREGNTLQRRYDIAYAQCMTSHGNALAMR